MLARDQRMNQSDVATPIPVWNATVADVADDAAISADPLPGGELAAFVAAVDAGSIQGAADGLTLTQSAVTKRIQALERRVGARLLDRGRHGVRPTELGRSAYLPARQALLALADVAAAVARSGGPPSVDLRLSASHTIGEFLLPGWLAEFRRGRPDVHAMLEIVGSRDVLSAIREGRSQVGFVEGLDALTGLDALSVARDELAVVVAADHPWARRRRVSARELASEAYLSREAGSGTRAVAAAALAAAGIELRPALEAASAQSLKRALAAGGFTVMSRLAIEAEERAGTLAAVRLHGVELRRELRAVRRRRPAAAGAARAFWQWLAGLAS
jgi:DNA-binding transcriptional LysR family regulator